MSTSHPAAPRRGSGPGSAARRRIVHEQALAAKRQRQRRTALACIAVVIALFAGLVIAKVADHPSTASQAATTTSASTAADVAAKATSVPAAVYAAVGTGGTTAQAEAVPGGTALTLDAKPEVLYLGAEYCPYCAAERWPLVLALSRFGTFTGLALTESSSSDVYPSTNTFTFLHATYTSSYLAFRSVELYDRNDQPLQSPTAAEQQLLQNAGQGGIPFIDLGGTTMLRSSGYSPQVLSGMTWTQIAAALTDADSPSTKAIVGTANRITGQLCGLTHDQPAAICQAPEVRALESAS
ncbi:DUF929 family protein [Actinospica sp. MGRD01-02]|uniref:DUF929 family protein n=1 Tax=Actinospica acidithermotolerans TaxID=2828514 RepID=A0A941EFY1_9ACTN|nr:DUF929 family protein [Actinospica acidithermotolerans]MBR7830702.1 DUF929 family protein [Actinospica acidithermotolerans]